MMCFAFASNAPWYQHRRGKQCLCMYKALLPCKNLLGSIPNPLNVQHPPGAALQPYNSVDLNKIAA